MTYEYASFLTGVVIGVGITLTCVGIDITLNRNTRVKL